MIDGLFNNRYEIKGKLGAGGTAVVYKGYDIVLGRMVTIKILREEYANDEDFVRRFRREAQAVASLSHGNIVAVYDVGYEENLHFIVMEYVEGESLKDYIRRKGALPVGEAVDIISQILDAVGYAHQHHIIHRDIKPHNILFTPDGRVKVTDFGIAVGLSDVTQTYTSSSRIMGSVHYISPEQVQGHAVDEKSDIYSVGVVFYEMLTGNLPFTGDTPIRIAMQHVQSQPDAPHHLNPQVPIGISYVVMRAMSKKPSARYASALEMQENIRSVYEGVNAVYQPTLDDEDFQKMSNTMELDPDELPKQDADNPENDDEYEDDQYDDEDDQYDDDDEDEDKEGFWHNHKKRKKKKSKKKKKKNKSHDKKRDDDDNKDDAKANQKNSNNKSKKSSQSNLKRNSLIVLSLVLTATLVFLGFRFFALGKGDIPMPAFIGKNVEEATLLADENDLECLTVYRPDDTVAKDIVIDQNIPEGQLIKKGRKIELTISQGPKEIPMPGLIGKTRREAETILQNNSLTVDLKEEYDSKVPAGQVISQYPTQGEMAAENSQVQLVVSKGSKPVYITMSNYLGSTLNDARVSLESKGLFVGKTKYEPSNEYYQGIVLGQSVKEGQDVREGESIDLTVSDGPGPVGKMATVNYTVPNDGLEHTVRIVVADTSGTHEEYNAKLVPGSEISPNVTFYNKGKITIYLDGEAVYSKDVT